MPGYPLKLARRTDGEAKRMQLLEAAGAVIAECGIDRATGKEIAERAGASTNAINYYFGGMQELHVEVLREAHRSLASFDELAAIAGQEVPPEEKLRQFLTVAVNAALLPRGPSWALQVLSREFFAPTEAGKSLRDEEILPKKQIVLAIIGEVLGRPVDDPAVERFGFAVLAPIMMLLVCEPESRRDAFPGIVDSADGARAFAEDLVALALNGLRGAARMGG
jgi:TetR/AcrR family transcriptional regulator, regulator of cefoperazone and chloramphenicol sensitivity